ncbi:MAG: S1 RNA-binding domain-containing protein, partial [Pseudomonadota bacterium]
RPELSPFAPRIITLRINPEQIGSVIGPGGKMINEIIASTGVTAIDIEDDGTIKISAVEGSAIDMAIEIIRGITDEPEVNKVYVGKVVKIMDFGAFVNFMGGRDGLVHISELADTRVAKTSDVVSEGQEVKVMVTGFDDRGKIKLSMKRVDQETGEPIAAKPKEERRDEQAAG